MEAKLSPPHRFAMVNPGIYRGAYPVLPNFRFLSRLQLKTIVSLTPEPPTTDIISFTEIAGCNSVYFPVLRTAALSDSMLHAMFVQVINLCLDSRNHPVFVHCLDGRRICSIFVLLMRKVQSWNPLFTFSEYWRYQIMFKPLPSESEIEKATKDLEKFSSETMEIVLSDSTPKWFNGGERPPAVSGVKFKPSLPPVPVQTAAASTTTSIAATTASAKDNNAG